MSWPSPLDYQEAIQNPGFCFADPLLKTGHPVLTPLGLPQVASGNVASVYEVRCGVQRFAVRCFHRQASSQQRFHDRLSAHLSGAQLPMLVTWQYQHQGIRVHGHWYPLIRMEWVEGAPLHIFVERHLGDGPGLRGLADQWREVVQHLRGAHIGHGDLQHGNVLVKASGQIRLVDYDGMFIPALRGSPSPELGHANYQHPQRGAYDYDERLDNFAALIVYLSLQAVAVDPGLWGQFHMGDNLILTAPDYQEPERSAAFAQLQASCDSEVQHLARCLARACQGTMAEVPNLEDALPGQSSRLGLASGLWWEQLVPRAVLAVPAAPAPVGSVPWWTRPAAPLAVSPPVGLPATGPQPLGGWARYGRAVALGVLWGISGGVLLWAIVRALDGTVPVEVLTRLAGGGMLVGASGVVIKRLGATLSARMGKTCSRALCGASGGALMGAMYGALTSVPPRSFGLVTTLGALIGASGGVFKGLGDRLGRVVAGKLGQMVLGTLFGVVGGAGGAFCWGMVDQASTHVLVALALVGGGLGGMVGVVYVTE